MKMQNNLDNIETLEEYKNLLLDEKAYEKYVTEEIFLSEQSEDILSEIQNEKAKLNLLKYSIQKRIQSFVSHVRHRE